MKLKNILIVVKDIDKSIKFYRDLFGLKVVLDNDGNVIMTDGLQQMLMQMILITKCILVMAQQKLILSPLVAI